MGWGACIEGIGKDIREREKVLEKIVELDEVCESRVVGVFHVICYCGWDLDGFGETVGLLGADGGVFDEALSGEEAIVGGGDLGC
jgi:hypothetical protein